MRFLVTHSLKPCALIPQPVRVGPLRFALRRARTRRSHLPHTCPTPRSLNASGSGPAVMASNGLDGRIEARETPRRARANQSRIGRDRAGDVPQGARARQPGQNPPNQGKVFCSKSFGINDITKKLT